jgi:MFS superfamily sulfate permease-like transporter
MQHLPLSVLGALIIVAVSGLIKVSTAVHLYKVSKRDFLLWLTAAVATLAVGVELGIGLAIGVSLLLVIHRAARPHSALLGRIPGTGGTYRNVLRFPLVSVPRHTAIVRFDAPLFFANSAHFAETCLRVRAVVGLGVKKTNIHTRTLAHSRYHCHVPLPLLSCSQVVRLLPEATALVLDLSGVASLDISAVHSIESLSKTLKRCVSRIARCLWLFLSLPSSHPVSPPSPSPPPPITHPSRHITLHLSGCVGPVRDFLNNAHTVPTAIPAAHVHTDVETAVAQVQREEEEEHAHGSEMTVLEIKGLAPLEAAFVEV